MISIAFELCVCFIYKMVTAYRVFFCYIHYIHVYSHPNQFKTHENTVYEYLRQGQAFISFPLVKTSFKLQKIISRFYGFLSI